MVIVVFGVLHFLYIYQKKKKKEEKKKKEGQRSARDSNHSGVWRGLDVRDLTSVTKEVVSTV